MCPRYDQRTGDLSHMVHNTQLYRDDIVRLMPPAFVQQINRINFCGNYGDPIVAKDLLPIIEYFLKYNPQMRIEVNTNGSARPEKWWRDLALLLGPDEAQGGVWWGLDGLGDTNHLYRRNTDWNIIMRNARAYIEKGGVAHWNFIAFKHNEHQIEEARALAKEMGFHHFNVKLTGRFKQDQSFPVMVNGEHIYDLEPAEAERHQRPPPVPSLPKKSTPKKDIDILARQEQIKAELRAKGLLDKPAIPVHVKPPTIECIADQEKCIYISAQGRVYPCCWIANAHDSDPQVNFEMDAVDAGKHTVQEIVEGPTFTEVADSWATGSIHRCVQFCGKNETDDKLKHGPDYAIHEQL